MEMPLLQTVVQVSNAYTTHNTNLLSIKKIQVYATCAASETVLSASCVADRV
jgi:hypothetical protein